MAKWGWLAALVSLVLTLPAGADEKDRKKAPEKPASASGPDLMAQADAKAAAGDVQGAAELLRKAGAAPGATGEPSLRLGRILEGAQDWDGAMDAYQAAAERLVGAAKGEALARLALAQEIRGVPAAGETAAAAAAADAEGAWPTVALARARAREGKGEEALALAQKAVAAGGGPAAQTALGAAEEARGQTAAAEAAYRAAGGAEGPNVAAAIGLARVLRKAGKPGDAEALLRKVIAASPGAVEAYKESARAKMALGRVADAASDAATAAALAENDPDALTLVHETTVAKALAYLTQNQPELAIQDLTKMRDQNPQVAAIRVGLGRALAFKRQADPALAELAKAVELDPASADAHGQMGTVLHRMKRDAPAAVMAFDKAVAADPGNLEYRTNLGAALVDAKQYDRAVKELQAVVASASYARPDAYVYLGSSLLAAKRYKEAVAALDKAIAIAPSSPEAEAYLAWSYFGLKDAANFKLHGAKARTLGFKEATLMQYLQRVEGGEAIK